MTCATRGVIDSVACDETTGHVECACGYVGREIKACWLREDAATHLRVDVETFKAREALNHPTVRWRP